MVDFCLWCRNSLDPTRWSSILQSDTESSAKALAGMFGAPGVAAAKQGQVLVPEL